MLYADTPKVSYRRIGEAFIVHSIHSIERGARGHAAGQLFIEPDRTRST